MEKMQKYWKCPSLVCESPSQKEPQVPTSVFWQQEVSTVVKFARQEGLNISVRSGGKFFDFFLLTSFKLILPIEGFSLGSKNSCFLMCYYFCQFLSAKLDSGWLPSANIECTFLIFVLFNDGCLINFSDI